MNVSYGIIFDQNTYQTQMHFTNIAQFDNTAVLENWGLSTIKHLSESKNIPYYPRWIINTELQKVPEKQSKRSQISS